MRGFTLLALCLLAGCENYNELKEDFCTTAKVNHMSVPLCDDFEASKLSSLWATNVTTGGALTIETYAHNSQDAGALDDPGSAYRGRSALRISAAAGATAQIVDTKITTAHAGADMGPFAPTAIRAFIWTGHAAPSTQLDVIDLVDTDGKVLRSFGLNQGLPTILDATSGQTATGGTQLEGGTWTCIELDSYPNELDFNVADGGILLTLGDLPTGTAPAATHIGLIRPADGIETTSEVWIDEVIMDHQQIGCDP